MTASPIRLYMNELKAEKARNRGRDELIELLGDSLDVEKWLTERREQLESLDEAIKQAEERLAALKVEGTTGIRAAKERQAKADDELVITQREAEEIKKAAEADAKSFRERALADAKADVSHIKGEVKELELDKKAAEQALQRVKTDVTAAEARRDEINADIARMAAKFTKS